MKKTTYIWAMGLALPLLLGSCNSKNAAGNTSDEDSTAVAAVSVPETDDDTSAEESEDEAMIFDDWSNRPITVKAEDGKVGIHAFAKAFCQEYSAIEPCAKMLSYLKNPAFFEKSEETFYVRDEPKSGYITCNWRFETSNAVTLCYWNRKNGHQLVGVTAERGFENDDDSKYQYMFYDYDKATGRMTPDMDVVKVFDKLAASYEDIFLYLPEEGKDIVVYAFNYGDDDESEDDDTFEDFIGKWDGMTFTIVPNKE